MSSNAFPLSPPEIKAKKHAILSSVGFLILLPLGVLFARYTRVWFKKWFWVHLVIQFLIAGPVIFAGWALGYKAAALFQFPRFSDKHQKIGLALLVLYLVQMFLGIFLHYFKFPVIFRRHRPPHSYLHLSIGVAIFILAAYQVHDGLYSEWPATTGRVVPLSAKHAWLALIIIFWALYIIGLVFMPRQLKQEKENRESARAADKENTVVQ